MTDRTLRAARRGPWSAPVPPEHERGPVPIDTGTAALVIDPSDPTGVTLLVNGVPSSFVDVADPSRLEFEYQQYMAALIAGLPDGPLRIVHLGAGACGLALALAAQRPGSRQVAVELDARLVERVRAWFDLPGPPALRIRTGDARARLERMGDGSCDVVVRDVFAGDRVPDHLVTVGAAREAARVLAPGGLYLANCADGPPLTRARTEAATLATVFEHVLVVAETGVLRGRRRGNVVLAAADRSITDLSARGLRAGPVPARVLHDHQVTDFIAGAAPRHDEPPTPG